MKSYLDFSFEVNRKSHNSRYGNGNDITLVNLGRFALFSIFKITTSSGKHLEDNSHAQLISPMYKLIKSAKHTDDLFLGFGRDQRKMQEDLTKNKKIKGNCQPRILLKDFFGFAEYQESCLRST